MIRSVNEFYESVEKWDDEELCCARSIIETEMRKRDLSRYRDDLLALKAIFQRLHQYANEDDFYIDIWGNAGCASESFRIGEDWEYSFTVMDDRENDILQV